MEGRLLLCDRAEVLKAKAACAAGDVDDCLYWLNQCLSTTLLSQARHPMIQAGMGRRNLRPHKESIAHQELYEFGKRILGES